MSRRDFLKLAGSLALGATGAVVLGKTLYSLSQSGADKEESVTFLQTLKSKVEPVSLDTEAQIDQKLVELGLDLKNVSTFKIKVNQEGGIGFAETSFAVSGRTPENNPRMFIQARHGDFTELNYWRTPDENGEIVNWYIPGKDVSEGKGIPGADGMQDILAYRITKDRQLSPDVYYLPPEDEIIALQQKEDMAGHMVPVDSNGFTSQTKIQLVGVRP